MSNSAEDGAANNEELRRLVEAWRVDQKACRECAESYEGAGQLALAKQCRAQAFGLGRCIGDLEKLLKETEERHPK